ncbi:MAG: hypothetical protein AB1599_01450 [Planctomycetota bacterium]
MSKILCRFKFVVMVDNSMPEWSGKKWEDGMINNASLINQKRKRKIPDQARYESRIAEASVNVYKNFIDPNFISEAGLTKKEIVEKHAKKISAGSKKYEESLDRMFADDGKLFKERVKSGTPRYLANAKKVIRLTGDKIRGLGASAIVPFWLVADRRIVQLSKHTAEIAGAPVCIVPLALRGPFKAGLEPLLVQTASAIDRADYDQATIDKMNVIVNRFISGLHEDKFVKFTPGGASHCDWMLEKSGEFVMDVQVSEK